MFKLILVFGVWINPEMVVSMKTFEGDCWVNQVETSISAKLVYKNKTCDQVAEEINKQMESK